MVRPRAAPPAAVPALSRARVGADVPDEDLAARVGAGDRWAAEALFRKHVDYITALSYRLLRDRVEAEDVVQETFLDALSQLKAAKAPEVLRSWLAGIAVHKVHRRFRRRKLRALLGFSGALDEGVLAPCAKAESSSEVRTELGLIDAALAATGDAERAAWVLRYVEGYDLAEVASLSGCSLATVKRRILKVQSVVRAHVDLEGVDHE